MAVFLSPLVNDAPYTVNGSPASAYKLFTYTAGTTTKQTTYTTSAGNVANSNPIILNSAGYAPNEIWLTSGVTYKFVLAPSNDSDPPVSPVWTRDNISAINDTTITISEWIAGNAPTFISTTSFTLAGDATSIYTKGLRLKFTVTAGTVYGTILTSVFTTLTTVTLEMDTGQVLDSGLSAVSYAILNAVHPSMPPYLETMPIAVDHSDPSKRVKVSATALPTNTTSTWSADPANVPAGIQGANIASAATINLDAATGDYEHITGSTGPVTAITLTQGRQRTVVFDSTPTLTNGASLLLRNGISRIAVAGEVATFRGEAAGVVREVSPITTKQQTRQVFTSGSGTYTTPSGVTRINVRLIGGGGGGSGSGTGGGSGGVGGNTTFSTLTGTGGALATQQTAGTGGAASGGDFNIVGGSGGGFNSPVNSVGGSGGNGPFGGGGGGGSGFSAVTGGRAGATNSGGGGGGAGSLAGAAGSGAGGGAGGYVEKLILTPAATYSYGVGAAGTAGAAGTSGDVGGAGGSGLIVVDEFYV